MLEISYGEGFAFAAVKIDAVPDAELSSQETSALPAEASGKRLRDFAAGRLAAREALKKLGLENPAPITIGAHRQPVWPYGIVGSISHSGGWAACLAAWNSAAASVGVDLETLKRKRRLDIAPRICVESEIEWVASANDETEHERRLIAVFSAKESAFKALFPLVQRYFGFKEIALSPEKSGFAAVLNNDLGPQFQRDFRFKIGVWFGTDFVLTAAVIPGTPVSLSRDNR